MNDSIREYLVKHMSGLETERLRLRRMKISDAADMYCYASKSEITRYLTWDPHKSLAYTKKYLRFITSKYRTGEFLDWGIELKSEKKLIGTCGFTLIDVQNCRGEFGYVIGPDFQRKGYAEEAVKALLDFAFNKLELNRMEARVIEGNSPSCSLLKKCGFTLEGIGREEIFVKEKFENVMHFSLLRNTYLSL